MGNAARFLGASLLVLMVAGTAPAVVVDGINDFPPSALTDMDGGDTEFSEVDIGDVYITNDANNLYIGYYHDPGLWGAIQVGISLSTIVGVGGTDDPWDRRIDFFGTCLPNFIAYRNHDSGYDDLVTWDDGGGTWLYDQYDINWVGFYDDVEMTYFWELEIPLAVLGVECPEFHQVHWEMWVTQDNCNKGPLDLVYTDESQLSTPSGTTWELNCDGSEDVLISCCFCYDIECPTGVDETTWGNVKSLWK